MKVPIIGGGIGGMSLALSLVAAGVDDVDIYESAPGVRELGVGIKVLPHAIPELTELGLLDQLSAVGIPTFTGRTAVATAELLGQQAAVFPSYHGGFLGAESGYAGQPEAFARKLRNVLDDDNEN